MLVGIVGLILPVMPGWIFVIPGLLILGDYFPPIRRLVEWAKARFAEADQAIRKRGGDASKATEDAERAPTDSDADLRSTQLIDSSEMVASSREKPQQ